MPQDTIKEMLPDLSQTLRSKLKESAIRLVTQSGQVNEAMRALDGFIGDYTDIVYEVRLVSLWPGERPITRFGRGSLERVVRRAAREFMRINRRSDVQARFAVNLKLGRGSHAFSIAVPDHFVAPILEQVKRRRSS